MRGMDSFAAFEEILILAKRHKVAAAGVPDHCLRAGISGARSACVLLSAPVD